MKTIPLTKGKVAIVDDRHYNALVAMGSWCYQSPGYAATRIKGRLVLMHRVVVRLQRQAALATPTTESSTGWTIAPRNLRCATPAKA